MQPTNNLNYKNNNRQIETKEGFFGDVQSLIQQFDNRINNLSSNHRHSDQGEPSKVFIDELNELKRQRLELVNLVRTHQNMDEQEWRQIKPDVQEKFARAERILLTKGEPVDPNPNDAK